MMALTPKPVAKYTAQEKLSVDLFNEYRELQQRAASGLSAGEQERLDELTERSKKDELRAFVSYTDAVAIYLIYTVIVALYTMMGGFLAAAITDVIQGILLTTFSIMLIPIALHRIGGFAGLHASVPDFMFRLFGSAATSEYAWYTILAMVIANLVSIIAVASGMQTAGSARNEMTARVGMIGGMFFKRFIMIFWALTGLLAIALYAGELHDPDLIWGHMTVDLLFPGAIGLMMAGILAAKMSALAGSSVSYSALFIRNLYQPFVAPKSERHLINVGRVAIAVTLLGGVGVALFIGNLLDMFKYFISLPAIFGAAIWLGFMWRRLTKAAVFIQVFICFAIYAVVPNLFQSLEWARTLPAFLAETRPQVLTITTKALREDVEAGRASAVGEAITKTHVNPPAGIYFEKVALTDPKNPDSPRIGIGRFQAEIYALSRLGVDFSGFSAAQLNAVRFGFDALFPFVLLFLLSAVTRPIPKRDLDRFFAKIHTPVQPTREDEEKALRHAVEHYDEIEKRKLRPGSSWEFMKPVKTDVLGFFGSWFLVGVIIFLLWLMVSIK
jgi:SSS family solute:Na+ symporter